MGVQNDCGGAVGKNEAGLLGRSQEGTLQVKVPVDQAGTENKSRKVQNLFALAVILSVPGDGHIGRINLAGEHIGYPGSLQQEVSRHLAPGKIN